MIPPDVMLDFAGSLVAARPGESIAAALTRANIRVLRQTDAGEDRGLFCGMGVCQDCAMLVDGEIRRACMTPVSGPHRIEKSGLAPPPPRASLPPLDLADIPVLTPDVVVVGGGAAGLAAAAIAAEADASVVLLDERSRPGGQYFKQPAAGLPAEDDAQFAGGRALIARARAAGVTLVAGAAVWGAFAPRDLAVSLPDGFSIYRPGALIVATGAYERAVPFPGWTLPGVMTTGAAQTLLRGEGVVAGRRVLVAGNGPLNLQVAVELARRGATVAAVVELAPAPGLRHATALWHMASAAPGLLRQGGILRWAAHRQGIRLLHEQALHSVERTADGLLARAARPAEHRNEAFEVDIVCTGYGFEPANEILRALGCRHAFDPVRNHLVTARDPDGATEVTGVFAAGDCCGLGGASAAVEEGLIAGATAAVSLGRILTPALQRDMAAARGRLAHHRRFQAGLWQLYAAPHLTTELATAQTPICRCEGVCLGTVEAALDDGAPSIGEVKRRTRLGMGACQGRYCAPILAKLLARRQGRPLDEMAFFAPQAPIKPIAIAALSRPAPGTV